MKLYTENFKINKNTKIKSCIDSDENFIEALGELLENLNDETYFKYVKNESSYFGHSLNYGSFNGVLTGLLFSKGKNLINTYSMMSIQDLVTILKYENSIEDKDDSLLYKYELDRDFCTKIIKHCYDIAQKIRKK